MSAEVFLVLSISAKLLQANKREIRIFFMYLRKKELYLQRQSRQSTVGNPLKSLFWLTILDFSCVEEDKSTSAKNQTTELAGCVCSK